MQIKEDLRQLIFPKSFRIDNYRNPNLSNLQQLLDAVAKLNLSTGSDSQANEELVKSIGAIGVVIWRLRKRTVSESDPPDKIRRISRDIDSAGDVMRQSDIEIKDHDGEAYDGGMRLRVISFQETPGLMSDKIIETIKPTIYYKGRMIRMGEVIVGTPAQNQRS
jgi:hypothetical protein